VSRQSSLRRTDIGSSPALTAYFGGPAGIAHNEAAFHHFLRIERGRAAEAGHGLALVLVRLSNSTGMTAKLPTPVAARVFAALGAAVREVDFVGWFREGRVAAAVLVQRSAPAVGTRQQIAGRVRAMLENQGVGGAAVARVRVVLFARRY
jgi:hypothetical protein